MKEQRNGLTTYEIDKLYEEESNGNWRLYIGKVAILNYDATSKHQLRYTHQDRLGSSLTYTDHNGQVTDRRMFDAFGKPRATDGNNLAIPKLQNPLLSRNGFTDHRHLDEVELIHMNGRAYDYNLGRFLSVDPIIQSPGNSQSLNPYSYIMNNPLAGTDPTGYACEAAIGSRICNSSVSASMTLENKTLKVHLSGGTEKQQLAAASAIVNGIQSQLAGANTLSHSGKAVDIGGQQNISSGNAAAYKSLGNQRFNDTDEPIDNGSVDAEARNLEHDANGYITRLEFYCDSVCRSNAENFSTITSDDIYHGLMLARMAEMQEYSNAYTLAVLGGFGLSQAKKLVVPLVRGTYKRYKELEEVYRSYRKEQKEACFSLVMAFCNPVSSPADELARAMKPPPFVPNRPVQSKYGEIADSVIHPRRFLDKLNQSGVVD